MTPRWESPFESSPRDAALLAEVLGALQAHLTDGSAALDGSGAQGGSTASDGVAPLVGQGAATDDGPTAEVRELISAAIAELHRVSPAQHSGAGIAPVLGSGVVHELLRRKREARPLLLEEPEPTVDERL